MYHRNFEIPPSLNFIDVLLYFRLEIVLDNKNIVTLELIFQYKNDDFDVLT